MNSKYIWQKEGLVYLALYVQPGASKSAFAGLHDDRLKVRISSPPVDGKANEALIDFLSKQLKLVKKQITISQGQTSRKKLVVISGASEDEVRSVLMTLMG
ncbi:MAG: YggU family protein [Pseudobdellovibrionaceae bacterium]|nr:YggU family protein [Bdellovibrionales bacterium]USN47221.1 MAG: YggU family protein [Pseudobdellovibrionaceae bacterium]